MPLIQLQGVSLAYGGPPLLERVDLLIERGERVCLLGRNGTGKSSLLRLIHGQEAPDDGQLDRPAGLRTALLPQRVPPARGGTVAERIAAGDCPGPDGEPGWEHQRRAEAVLRGLGLDPDEPFAALSGGLKRRVYLARALIAAPDLLLLDEPTNHLDIDAIRWLEGYLARQRGALLFVTHDRAFLGRLATRILELDRGTLVSYPGDHASYLRRRDERLAAEETRRARFDRKLAEEESWIRQGIKARRRRNEGRVRALEAMREQRRQRRTREGRARFAVQHGERSGKLVIEARGLGFAYGGGPPGDAPTIVRDLDLMVMRGDKVGLIGPNGIGKTTLLRVLLGQLEPTAGTLRHGTHLDVAYLDQLRALLRDDRSVADNVADGADSVRVGGQTRHVISYLKDFLFAPERARSPITELSGGERNRLLLARLFARPSNVLVLDEPTNDLDTETLELLEERLAEYPGTVLLVSHDRAFLDHVVTSSLVFEGQGRVVEYVGGYSDWQRQRAADAAPPGADGGEPPDGEERPRGKRAPAAAVPADEVAADRPRKLTYAERLELDELPARIEALEADRDAAQQRTADPDFYRAPRDEITAALARLEQLERDLEQLYERWESLEARADAR